MLKNTNVAIPGAVCEKSSGGGKKVNFRQRKNNMVEFLVYLLICPFSSRFPGKRKKQAKPQGEPKKAIKAKFLGRGTCL